MTAQRYNVEMDDAKWAETKAELLIPERRYALMKELITQNQQGALDILSEIGRAEHGERAKLRKDKNHRVAAA